MVLRNVGILSLHYTVSHNAKGIDLNLHRRGNLMSGNKMKYSVGNLNLFCIILQNDSGVHPASYPMGTRGSFLGDKAVGARS
jgi:hypothetical protein